MYVHALIVQMTREPRQREQSVTLSLVSAHFGCWLLLAHARSVPSGSAGRLCVCVVVSAGFVAWFSNFSF